MKTNLNKVMLATLIGSMSMFGAQAVEKSDDSELKDMSDPMAIYSQAGAGVSDRGINFKYGQTYDTGSDTKMGMNIVEVKGMLGETLGWSGSSKRDNSIDSFRIRNFQVDMKNGLGTQIDVNYDVERENASASYSFMQALPKMGPVNLYPFAGLGLNIQNNAVESIDQDGNVEIDSGYSMPGVFGVIGMYGKLTITDKIWMNYNPTWVSALSGSDFYKDNAYGMGKSDFLAHEVILSYQVNPRLNFRYFANFNEDVNFADGEHRLEFNYQF